MQASQRKQAHIFLAIPDAVVYTDTDQAIELINPAFEALFGYSQEEILGRKAELLYADGGEEQHTLDSPGVSEVTWGSRLVRYRRKDGSTFLGEATRAPVADETGREIGYTEFIRDVTRRTAALDALATEKAHYEGLVEYAADLIYRADAQGYFTYVNPVALRRFGYTADEILGRHFIDLVRPDASERVIAFYREQINNGAPTTYLEFPALAQSGEVIWVGQNMQVVWGEEGGRAHPIGIQAVARDITEQKRLEDELREAKAEAESSERAKEQFLATMSHEIRTPLNAVLGLAHLLTETALADEQTEYVGGIRAATDALLGLVNDILDYARIEEGRLEFEAIPFLPTELLRDLVLLLGPRAEAKRLSLRLALDPALPEQLVGDPHRLRQVLINLISNAIKFTEEGGVTVRVSPVPSAGDGASTLRFEVADTGIGIPQDQHERIFESFTQARGEDARMRGGSGLGLAIVKEIVEGQDGQISMTSTEGEGSRFVVTLPFRECATEIPQPSDVETVDLDGLNILLAEDIEANQFVATRMLERWGVTITLARNGREAVERIGVAPDAFDLVLMDLQMPEMDGLAATRVIRKDLGLSNDDLPVVALTASVLARQRNEVLAAGFDDFVLKPFDPDDLRRKIGALTGRIREADRQPINEAVLERFAMSDASFIAELAGLFCREVPTKVAALAEAAEAGAWEEVRALAHQTKTQAAYVGAELLAEALAEVDLLSRGQRAGDVRVKVKHIVELCRVAEEKLVEFVPKAEDVPV